MKKYLLGVLLLLTFVATPVFVEAAKTLTFPANIYSIPMADSYRSSGSSILFVTVPIKKTFTANSVYTLSITKPIYGLQISADTTLSSPDSLVRVILNDKSNKDYLVFEGSPSIMGQDNFSIINFCQETCVLNGVIPVSLKIEVLKGSLTLNSIFTIDSSSKLKISSADTPLFLVSKLNIQQTNYKISQLNNLNTKNGSSWVAGSSDVCNMTYDQKKQLFKDEKGVVPDYLPNLQGFDCYKGGVFSIAGGNTASVSSVSSSLILPDNYDWRNINGENWMTSVKDQGGAGTCWAFAAMGAMESQINIYYNKNIGVDLSEQQYVDSKKWAVLPIGMQQGSETYPECWDRCHEGFQYCTIKQHGIADEQCDPYVARVVWPPDLSHICSDWSSRIWKNSDFHDYIMNSDFGDNLCQKQSPVLTIDELKKIIIEKGPLNSAIMPWKHGVVLEGFSMIRQGDSIYFGSTYAPAIIGPGDPLIGRTAWIYKNSWGSDWGDAGYFKMLLPLSDIAQGMLPIGPFTPPTNHSYWPAGFDGKVSCVDKDSDNYCNWGISEQPPTGTVCPATCKKDSANKYIKDCDDSKNTSGSFISSTNLNCASISTPATTCIDSDGGLDPYVKGYTIGYDYRGIPTIDYDAVHINPYGDGYNYVVEWFCSTPVTSGSVYRMNTNIKCQYGSGNGVCLRPTLKAPTISFITPTKVNQGAKVSVYGTNFDTNTYVLIDGLKTIKPLFSGTGVLSFIVPTLTTGEYHTVKVLEIGSSFPASNSASLFIWASLPTPTPSVSATTCTDSDGGKDPYVKGYTVGYDTNGTKSTVYDQIRINPYGDGYNYVVEWFCTTPFANGSVYRTNTNIRCLYGYANGRCLRFSPSSNQTPITTYTPRPTVSVAPTRTPTPTVSSTPTPVATYTPTPKPTVSATPSQTPTVTVSPEPSPSPVSVSEQVQTASVFSPLSWFWGLFGK